MGLYDETEKFEKREQTKHKEDELTVKFHTVEGAIGVEVLGKVRHNQLLSLACSIVKIIATETNTTEPEVLANIALQTMLSGLQKQQGKR